MSKKQYSFLVFLLLVLIVLLCYLIYSVSNLHLKVDFIYQYLFDEQVRLLGM